MSTFRDMVDFIKSANKAKAFIVPCMYGPSGIGKTDACRQAVKELAEEGKATGRMVTIIVSQILPNEVSGITMPVHETKAMEIYDHYRLSSLQDGDLLFFDELLEADQLVLSACLTLIESRELMSGRKLPDIQIVAATNETIPASMLKDNIKQRFSWREFDVDKQGCRDHIKETYGIDIGRELADQIQATGAGKDYNILSPRQMTKMAKWMMLSDSSDEAKDIAKQINAMWKNTLGTNLYKAWLAAKHDPNALFRSKMRSILWKTGVTANELGELNDGMQALMTDDSAFELLSMSELMSLLQKLPEWEQIQQELESMTLEDYEEEIEIDF